MSRNTLWSNQDFRSWLKTNGKDDKAVLCFASNHHLRKLTLEYYSQKNEKQPTHPKTVSANVKSLTEFTKDGII